ncbi:MAG TPA: hypothetical protein VLI67_08590, partial [Vicinamibacteria bacterium]|nr:hypothetical protein [Vicinamibacteria bacterium]
QGLVSGRQACPVCLRSFEAVRFDPPPPDLAVPRLGEAGPEASHACAGHSGNAAVAHCSRCGVFMCPLCRIEADGMALCPACFERLSDEGALPSAIATYRDYGRLARALAVLGLLLPLLAPAAGPGGIYYGARRLKQIEAMKEDGGRGGVYAVIALAALETALGFGIVWMMVAGG